MTEIEKYKQAKEQFLKHSEKWLRYLQHAREMCFVGYKMNGGQLEPVYNNHYNDIECYVMEEIEAIKDYFMRDNTMLL